MAYTAHPTAIIDDGASVGEGTRIWHWTHVCGVTIGQYAFVGAGAVVTDDVPDFALMLGVPAKRAGWMSRYGERLDLPLEGKGETKCAHTGDRYRLAGDRCQLVS